ncbi:hypothetical protein BCY86_03525 [Pajaroellobacter abortibovis]|uniref:Uncharacterized protein n=1 Tax=Pajaroellobacter abortibovis TaxID=1882918 RepID=A0A1L6MWQ0_9BACT|nr:hypothetical protein BCY86_03525 [Pajaroellobacter abortibovis]
MQALLTVLHARGLEVSDNIQSYTLNSSNLDQFDRWFQQSLTIESANDLLKEAIYKKAHC